MKCEIIERDTYFDLEDAINRFISNKIQVNVSVSSHAYEVGYAIKEKYLACILYV